MRKRAIGRTLERPLPGTPPLPRPPHPLRWTLENGLRVVAVRRTTLPQVAMRIVVPAGSATDPAGEEGLASLTGNLLTEGTDRLTAEELNRRLDEIGASLTVQVGHDFAEVDLLLLAETLEEGVGLLADVLGRPAFPEPEIERLRAETVDALEARLDEPANVADDRLSEALFGAEHPYGRLPMGSIESVQRLTRDRIARHHESHYRPGGAVLIAAGDFEPDALRALLEHALAGWRGAAKLPTYASDPAPLAGGDSRLLVDWPDARQAEIRVGGAGMQRDSPDWIAGAVANYLLGGSTITGRLGANLREEKGWTYGVRSGFAASIRRGGWSIETAVDAEVVAAAIGEITAELTRFLAEPVPEAELRRGKDALILSLPRAFETPGRIVSRLATVEAYGLPDDYWQRFAERVEEVNRDDVLRIAHRYFDPAGLVTITVGG